MHDDPTTLVSGTQIAVRDDRPVLAQHRLRLRVVSGIDSGLERAVDGEQFTIGSSSKNDLVLGDPKVSRRHCVVLARDEGYHLRDLGSTNGTTIDGTRVLEAEIGAGAHLHVGETTIQFLPKRKWIPIQASKSERFGAMLGRSMDMREVFGMLERVAPTRLSVLLRGETGTGKELAARAIHDNSKRSEGPFVVVDCGAMAENLIESELFGHERGAFTGAERSRMGAFEQARGGTVFLDELGELPIDLQPLLLRVLENREVKRLGATKHFSVDVRVISATNRRLEEMVEEGGFREDLYYRMTEVVIELPPLRNRDGDIALIAQQLIEHEARHGGRVKSIAPETIEMLATRQWPGNVRELRNTLRRAIAFASNEHLRARDLMLDSEPSRSAAGTDELTLPEEYYSLSIDEARDLWNEDLDRQYIEGLIDRCDGDEGKAAEKAGMYKKSLRRLMRRRGLKTAD